MAFNANDMRKVKIKTIVNGELITFYEGGAYFYFNDYENDGCIHWVDSEGKHHRVYDAPIFVDEI